MLIALKRVYESPAPPRGIRKQDLPMDARLNEAAPSDAPAGRTKARGGDR